MANVKSTKHCISIHCVGQILCQPNIMSARYYVSQILCWPNILSAKYCVIQILCQPNIVSQILSAKCLMAKCLMAKCLLAKCLSAKYCVGQVVFDQKAWSHPFSLIFNYSFSDVPPFLALQ
jgi:hypothetical protein